MDPSLIFSKEVTPDDASRWFEGFNFYDFAPPPSPDAANPASSPPRRLPPVLRQIHGGPCAVFSCIQAHVIVQYHFLGVKDPTQALVNAMAEILIRCALAFAEDSVAEASSSSSSSSSSSTSPHRTMPHSSSSTITTGSSPLLVKIMTRRKRPAGDGDDDEEPRNLETLIARCEVTEVRAMPNANSPHERDDEDRYDASAIRAYLAASFDSFRGKGGLLLFVMSAILSRGGADAVRRDMDDQEVGLVGRFGFCGQEMLNLLLTGRATSQVCDDNRREEEGAMIFRGVRRRPKIGFLSQYEFLSYVSVGSYLKNPDFPVWVLGTSSSHFIVLYATDRHADTKTEAQLAFESARRAFDARDTHGNGFVTMEEVEPIYRDLGIPFGAEEREHFLRYEGGLVLWDDFWNRAGETMMARLNDGATGGKGAVDGKREEDEEEELGGTWTCPACTFAQNLNLIHACDMCGTAKPSSGGRGAPKRSAFARGDFEQSGGRQISLVVVDGLQKTVGGRLVGPLVRELRLTTVDETLAEISGNRTAPTSDEDGRALEEILHTKWKNCILE